MLVVRMEWRSGASMVSLSRISPKLPLKSSHIDGSQPSDQEGRSSQGYTETSTTNSGPASATQTAGGFAL